MIYLQQMVIVHGYVAVFNYKREYRHHASYAKKSQSGRLYLRSSCFFNMSSTENTVPLFFSGSVITAGSGLNWTAQWTMPTRVGQFV